MMLTVILGTLHFGGDLTQNRSYQDVNPGVLVHAAGGAVVGAYRNSENRLSLVLATRRTLARSGPWAASVTVGAVSGYRPRVVPLVLPTISYGPINASYVPSARVLGAPRGANGVNFSYTVTFAR